MAKANQEKLPTYALIPVHDENGVDTGRKWPPFGAVSTTVASSDTADEISVGGASTAVGFLGFAFLVGTMFWQEVTRGQFRI